MTALDADLHALRADLAAAIERDLARPRRRPRRRSLAALLATGTVVVAGGAGVAAATGILFADPEPDPAVPAAAEWLELEHHPYDPSGTSGPVLVRPRPEALARTNRATEAALARQGTTARCGTDPAHPLACYLPSGDPVPAPALNEALASLQGADVLESSRDHYEIRPQGAGQP